jgi:hypothetical protein
MKMLVHPHLFWWDAKVGGSFGRAFAPSLVVNRARIEVFTLGIGVHLMRKKFRGNVIQS